MYVCRPAHLTAAEYFDSLPEPPTTDDQYVEHTMSDVLIREDEYKARERANRKALLAYSQKFVYT